MSKKQLALLVAPLLVGLVPGTALAQTAAAASNGFDVKAMTALGAGLGAGLAIGLAALGGGMGQGRAVAAALEGISRNPGAADRVQTPMILGLALIESLVLFAFAIAFLLQSNLGGGG